MASCPCPASRRLQSYCKRLGKGLGTRLVCTCVCVFYSLAYSMVSFYSLACSMASRLLPGFLLLLLQVTNKKPGGWRKGGVEKRAMSQSHYVCRYGYRLLIENSCADVLQPDITWMGGITEVCDSVYHTCSCKIRDEPGLRSGVHPGIT